VAATAAPFRTNFRYNRKISTASLGIQDIVTTTSEHPSSLQNQSLFILFVRGKAFFPSTWSVYVKVRALGNAFRFDSDASAAQFPCREPLQFHRSLPLSKSWLLKIMGRQSRAKVSAIPDLRPNIPVVVQFDLSVPRIRQGFHQEDYLTAGAHRRPRPRNREVLSSNDSPQVLFYFKRRINLPNHGIPLQK